MNNPFRGKGYYWATGAFFAGSFALQWATHDGTTAEFWNAAAENWQSEFLQLLWQVGGLAILFAAGSSQSKHESARLEDKIDHLIRSTHGYGFMISDGKPTSNGSYAYGFSHGAEMVDHLNAAHDPRNAK